MRKRLAPALLLLIAALALCVGLAVAAPFDDGGSKDPAGDVHAAGLTPAQKAAVDIVGVHVSGAENVGAFVTVTFRGDFEKELGRGALAHAAAALILRPRTAATSSAGLVTSGAGKIGKVQRHTKSTTVGSFRSGSKLTFFVLGPGWSTVGSALVETVADAVPLGKKAFSLQDGRVPYLGPRLWDKFVTRHPLDGHVQVTKPKGLSCDELRDLLDDVDTDLGDPYFTLNTDADVTKALRRFRSKVTRLLKKCPPPPTSTVGATFAWSRFSPDEVAGSGKFTGPAQTFQTIRIVLPDQYSITNHLCPTQLPAANISANSIECGGGTLSTGETFQLNLQTSPRPPADIGGQLFGQAGGTTFGPFRVIGP